MKVIVPNYGIGMTQTEKYAARATAADLTRTRGTSQPPAAPIGVLCQPGPQGLFVTWNYPPNNTDITGWRVYKGDQTTLYAEIKDRGTRQYFVLSTNAIPVNIFVSSLNAAGVESPKVASQGTPGASTAPMPNVPPGYNKVNSGGGDTSSNYIDNGKINTQ